MGAAERRDLCARAFFNKRLAPRTWPAICEEIAFRGVLLHGLRQRLKPVPLCLVVGLVFAMFHLDLVRLLPTAILGALLAALTLRTGSIYPAMLWHGLNNGTTIVLSHLEVSIDELSPLTHGGCDLSCRACFILDLAGWAGARCARIARHE